MLHFINIYNNPNHGAPAHLHHVILCLLQFLPLLPLVRLVQGDFNLHCSYWDPDVKRNDPLVFHLLTMMVHIPFFIPLITHRCSISFGFMRMLHYNLWLMYLLLSMVCFQIIMNLPFFATTALHMLVLPTCHCDFYPVAWMKN